jgi:hypothetical protein
VNVSDEICLLRQSLSGESNGSEDETGIKRGLVDEQRYGVVQLRVVPRGGGESRGNCDQPVISRTYFTGPKETLLQTQKMTNDFT